MVKTPRWDLPFAGNSGQDVDASFNDFLRFFDAFSSGLILDKDLTAPPGGESTGDAYIVGGSATGAWSGQDDDLAVYYYGSWYFLTPWNGLTVWVDDESSEYRWETNAWTQVSGGGVTGSAANDQVAVWSGTSSLDGSSSFTYNGSTVAINTAGGTTDAGADDFTIGGTGDTGMTISSSGTGDQNRIHMRSSDNKNGFIVTEHSSGIAGYGITTGYNTGSKYIQMRIDMINEQVRFRDSIYDPFLILDDRGPIFIREQGSASSDIAAFGQYWVGSGTTNRPLFTDDTGTDHELINSQLAVPGGRLTATSLGPEDETIVTAGTAIYYTRYIHDQVPIYNGAFWEMRTITTQLTNTLTDSTDNPAATVADTNYDLFVWDDGGTLKLGRGPAWTNDTTRSLSITYQAGVGRLVNAAAITNGASIYQGTYVGTFRTNGSNQVEFRPLAGDDTNSSKVLHWNMYNRKRIACYRNCKNGVANTFTYHSTTVRQFAGNSYQKIELVNGLDDTGVVAHFQSTVEQGAANDSNTRMKIGSNIDATNAFESQSSATQSFSNMATDGTNVAMQRANGAASHTVPLGYHYIALVEAHPDGTSGAYTGYRNDSCISLDWEY